MNLIFEKIRIFFSNNIYSIQIRKESKTTVEILSFQQSYRSRK